MEPIQVIRNIQTRIYNLRGQRVIIDFDLAQLYQVETKAMNQAVKRNIKRFPGDFMFELTAEEWDSLRHQLGTTNNESFLKAHSVPLADVEEAMRSQIVTSKKGRGGLRYLPYAFTEQGVAMLSGILRSDRAIEMNVAIMRAFVELRKILLMNADIAEQLRQLKEHLGEHDAQLNGIYDAIENLLDESAAANKWEGRERIGFRKR